MFVLKMKYFRTAVLSDIFPLLPLPPRCRSTSRQKVCVNKIITPEKVVNRLCRKSLINPDHKTTYFPEQKRKVKNAGPLQWPPLPTISPKIFHFLSPQTAPQITTTSAAPEDKVLAIADQ